MPDPFNIEPRLIHIFGLVGLCLGWLVIWTIVTCIRGAIYSGLEEAGKLTDDDRNAFKTFKRLWGKAPGWGILFIILLWLLAMVAIGWKAGMDSDEPQGTLEVMETVATHLADGESNTVFMMPYQTMTPEMLNTAVIKANVDNLTRK